MPRLTALGARRDRRPAEPVEPMNSGIGGGVSGLGRGVTVTGRAVVLVGALALTVSACAGGSGSGQGGNAVGKPVNGKTFTQALASDPGTLDPHMTVLSVALQVDRYLYDSLLNQDSHGGPTAGLAEKWQATTKTATFTLRSGITCSDGSPLTAEDVAANINFVADPANKSPMAGLAVAVGTKAKAVDATRTVSVTSGASDAFLLRNVGSLPIACAAGLKNRALLAKGRSGTGMFSLTEAVPNDHYTLTRRKDYAWGPGQWDENQPGLPDKVVVRVIPNGTTAANLLLTGQLNAGKITGADRQRLTARKLFHADEPAAMGQLFYNESAGRPGADESVRRALTGALDLPKVGKVLTSGTGKPATGMIVSPSPACPGDTVTGNLPAHDVSAAKAALDAAGWHPGSDGIRTKGGKRLALTVVYATQVGTTAAASAELVQQMWKEVGADVKLKAVDGPGLSEVLFQTGSWDVSMAPFGFTLPSQDVPFVSGAVPSQGTNFAHIKNATYEAHAHEAAAMSGKASCPAWLAAEKALIKRVDLVPYYNSVNPYFGNGARFGLSEVGILPSTIRMYAK